MRLPLLLILLAALTACAHYPTNAPLQNFNPHAGYRFDNFPPTEKNTDDLFIVLALSGGGSRSAAFSFGLLEELRKTPLRHPARSLLDEVDVISSVSSGSITAAYFAQYADNTFTTFPQRFLYQNFQAASIADAANPLNWPRLASPHFSRTDLLEESFDKTLYHGETYADLLRAHRRPYLLLNAADISLASRFEFSQEQFDFLYSDLASVPLARAVTASMAYPVFLEPLRVQNYPRKADFHEPAWVDAALKNSDTSRRVARRAADLRSYENTATRRNIRLLDGAYGDYMGLQGTIVSFISPDGDFSLRRMIDQGKIKKLIVISVNAARTPGTGWDNRDQGPGWFDMLYFGLTAPIRNNAQEMVTVFKELLKADHARPDAPAYDSYFISVDFSGVSDPAVRSRLEEIQTSLSLEKAQADELRQAAGEALRNSPEFARLVKDLQ